MKKFCNSIREHTTNTLSLIRKNVTFNKKKLKLHEDAKNSIREHATNILNFD